ncbi:cytochrome P450 [Mycobacterium sp. SM1]|uniref:cytochrome P450 n=1 Tax=Mycobacterium sp. SM1 TaxID=2816243 RepID=UPI001BCB2395|nr:cytochrome P450 [Mycobacterium sp. SM1]MBS4728569.1 cytochrome P450 [Mycobacterium sp. SM1]
MTSNDVASNVAAKAGSACPITGLGAEFDPFDPAYVADPYPWFHRARHEEPVFYSPEIDRYVVTRYSDIKNILTDTESWSADIVTELVTPLYESTMAEFAQGSAIQYLTGPTLVNEDGPQHTLRRKRLMPSFSPKALAALEPQIRTSVNEYISKFVKKGRADLVDDFVWELPVRVLFTFMGIPEADAHYVKEFSAERAVFSWGRPDEQQQNKIAQEVNRFAEFCEHHIARQRANPGNDLASEFVKFNQEEPELFPDIMPYSYMINFMFAGHETTTSAAASMFRHLLENRPQWEAVCRQPELIPKAVEETLRQSPSLVAWHRRALKPMEVGGVSIPENGKALIVLGSANHDEEVFGDNSEEFDISRPNANRHLAFGFGKHTCLGAPLARMELRVFLEETTRRLPHLRLVENQKWEFNPNVSFRGGPRHVLVEWDPDANPFAQDRP